MARPFPPCPGVRHSFHDVASGVRLHVAEAGPEDGRPVVLQHGWPQHWWCFRGVIPALADAGFRVIAPDLRGSGWSDAPPRGYDKEQFASDTLALLDAMGLERVAFVGHDWGGWTGQLVALRAPERIERLMLLNIASVWGGPKLQSALNSWRLGYQVVGVPKLGPALQRSRLMRKGYPGVPEAAAAEFAAAMREPARAEAGLAGLPHVRHEGARGDRLLAATTVRRLTMPVKVLHGTADPVVRPFLVEEFRAHCDDVEIEWAFGTGHFIADEQPALVAERLLAFLG